MNEKINNGLTQEQANKLLKKYGKNILMLEQKNNLGKKILDIIKEPMFLLLIASSLIYFILGEYQDGLIMLIFVLFIIIIEFIQEWKTDRIIASLKKYSSPKVIVKRNGENIEIDSSLVVPGDIMLVQEGMKVVADGQLLGVNNLMIDESILTGESISIQKTTADNKKEMFFKRNWVYAGTMVIQGSGIVEVKNTGLNTQFGKIGKSLVSIENGDSPLKRQTDKIIKYSMYIAIILFISVFVLTFIFQKNVSLGQRIIDSILSGITIAMAMIPEEFPVILVIFLAMGAGRLAKNNSIVKKMASIETLGSISVLCVDKTGTLTKNIMEVHYPYSYLKDDMLFKKLVYLSCDDNAIDPTEKALIKYTKNDIKLDNAHIIKTYPFTHDSKIMGVVVEEGKNTYLIAKGSFESILKNSSLTKEKKKIVDENIDLMLAEGLRIIAIGYKKIKSTDIKENLDDYKLSFAGALGLFDPPKEDIKHDIAECYQASIKVIMITGDNGITASSIGKDIGLNNYEKVITGKMLDEMKEEEFLTKLKDTSIFSRVTPEHKFMIVEALKKLGYIVGMTGDGVNDAQALKAADVGIAMGKRGSEVAREAADLILLDDDFSTIVKTIRDGRKIYNNIQKAFIYVLMIHTPIALSAIISPILSSTQSMFILLPIHVVLLELIIDPTCSIVLERNPAPINIMNQPPRNQNKKIISFKNLLSSYLSGILIAAFAILSYIYYLDNPIVGRTMAISIMIFSSIFYTQKDKNIEELFKDKVVILSELLIIIIYFLIIYTNINTTFKLTELNIIQLILCIMMSYITILIPKLIKKIKRK